MAEKPPEFIVVDRRKFTAEGEYREGFAAPESETPAASAEPAKAPEPAAEQPKVVTMPVRTPEAAALSAADNLSEEDLSGAFAPVGKNESIDWEPTGEEPAFADDDAEDDADDEMIGAPRSAAETATQDAAYRASSRELDAMLSQANPGMQKPGVVTFEHVIQSFYLSAIMAMGADAQPGEKPRIDILGARQSIDMLTVLEEKTKGNLSPQESQLLQGITFELRMMFLELTNAISKQAQQPPPTGGRR